MLTWALHFLVPADKSGILYDVNASGHEPIYTDALVDFDTKGLGYSLDGSGFHCI